MNPREAKVRQKIVDRWYSDPNKDFKFKDSFWGKGIIKKISKTRIYVKFEKLDYVVAYDYTHFREFVEKGNYFSK